MPLPPASSARHRPRTRARQSASEEPESTKMTREAMMDQKVEVWAV
ncbi:MAG: hypothetical protein HYU42_07010 [Candidatus Rokubacteria bacterium]|nr:hypothetical protein [Candidatus Rokubacteria bacterium]